MLSRAQSGTSSLAFAAGFYLSFRLFIMLLAVVLSGVDPQTGVMLDLCCGYVLCGLVAVECSGRTRSQGLQLLAATPARWAMLFLVFTGCSLAWSIAASLPAALAYWCGMAANAAMVMLLVRSFPMQQTTDRLLQGFVRGACVVAIIAWLLPASGGEDTRLGYEGLIGTNPIGYLCAFAFFMDQYLVLVRRQKHTAALVLLGVTLLRSLSKTTIIAFAVSQAFLLLSSRIIGRRRKKTILFATLAVLLVFSGVISAYLDTYTQKSSQAETLTGRVGIWAIMISDGLERPWFGHGFHSVWKVIPPYGPDQFEVRHAHNELIQQFYAYGISGVVMMFGLYASFLLATRRLPRSPLRSFLFALTIFVLIRGLADTEVFDLSLPMWAVFLFSALMLRETHAQPEAARHSLPADMTKPASLIDSRA